MRWNWIILVAVLGAFSWPVPTARAEAPSSRPSNLMPEAQWYRATTLDVFDRYAPASAPWRKSARAAIEAQVQAWLHDREVPDDQEMIAWNESYNAIKQGCDDPMLLSIRAMLRTKYSMNKFENAQVAGLAQRQMQSGPYPPIRRFYAALFAGDRMAALGLKSDDDQKQFNALMSRCRSLFVQVIADPNLPRRQLLDLFDQVGRVSLVVYGDRGTLALPLLDVLQKSNVDRSTVLTMVGAFNDAYGSDARGMDSADTVSADRQRLMFERWDRAIQALDRAWHLDHQNAFAAEQMLDAMRNQESAIDTFEMWFKRVYDVYPDDYRAFLLSLAYLEPRWHGMFSDGLKFAHQWAEAVPPSSPLRLLIVDEYISLSHYGPNGWQAQPDLLSFLRVGKIWQEINRAYVPYLNAHPQSRFHHLRYAQLAGWCGHWDIANREMQQYGDWFDPRVFPTYAQQQHFMAEAARRSHPSGSAAPASRPSDLLERAVRAD